MTRKEAATPVVNVVVTCTDRKKLGPASEHLLRNCPGQGPSARAKAWVGRLSRRAATRTAWELYAGDHWAVVRSIPDAVHGVPVQIWVASAGYGLVPAAADLKSYGATFVKNQADSVLGEDGVVGDLREWWAALAEWEGPAPGAPRTVAELARRFPAAPLLVAASPPYLNAMANDIATAASLVESDSLSVISSKMPARAQFPDAFVKASAKLQAVFQGSCISNTARVLRDALQSLEIEDLRASKLRTRYQQMAARHDLPVFDRIPLADGEVRDFIAKRLKADGRATHTASLRALRESGKACGQKRFKYLFGEVYLREKGVMA